MDRAKFKDLTAPVRKVQQWIASRVDVGEAAECPCCGRAIGYELRLQRVHVIELMRLARAASEQAKRYGGKVYEQGIHVPTVLGADAESYSQDCISQLKHFGLVEKSGSKLGWWKLTRGGMEFLVGELEVPRAAWLFNSKLVHYVAGSGTAKIHDLVTKPEYDSYMKEGSAA